MGVTNYIWDVVSDNVLMEVDDNGNTIASYEHEPGLHGELISQRRNGHTYYHHYDGMGNTVAVTDENENVVEAATYSAFGEVAQKTSSIVNPFGYKGALGYYTNPTTNDLYVRARMLQPTAGRWLSPDPLGFPEGTNRYWYALNNPVLFADPSGHQAMGTWAHHVETAPNMDCSLGYDIKIGQTFTSQRTGPAGRGVQTWQLNTGVWFAVIVKDSRCGLVPQNQADRTWHLLDVNDIGGKRSPVKITDTIGLRLNDPNVKSDDVCLFVEVVSKQLGFNSAGTQLPTGTYSPNQQQLQTIGNMIGAFLHAKTRYVYLNKEVCCVCPQNVIALVKNALRGAGSNWDDLPSVHEEYTYADLGSWYSFCGASTSKPCCDEAKK